MGMKSKLVAVFGHYDSRGGTAAVEMKEATMEEYTRACRVYNRNWCLFSPEDEATLLADGNEFGATMDFIFVAELHYQDGADVTGDLEAPSSSGKTRHVLVSGDDPYPGEDKYPSIKETGVLKATLEKPVQLELIELDDSSDPELNKLREAVDAARMHLDHILETSGWGPEYSAANEKWIAADDAYRTKAEEKAVAQAKVIEDPHTHRWDDDAYGFAMVS